MSAGPVAGGPACSPIAIRFGEELTFERGGAWKRAAHHPARFTRSRSSPSANEVISMPAGSRPASRAISRNFGRTSRISPVDDALAIAEQIDV